MTAAQLKVLLVGDLKVITRELAIYDRITVHVPNYRTFAPSRNVLHFFTTSRHDKFAKKNGICIASP